MNGLTWLMFGVPWLLAARARAGQNPPVAQIDCTWLAVDTTAKTATFQLVAGVNFNGFKSGALTFAVPLNWSVAIALRSQDSSAHVVAVIDSVKLLPTGPFRPAFPGAMTTAATDTLRFVATRPGSYLIVRRAPGPATTTMWMRFRVSAVDQRPFLAATRTR
jgi:hypothetical protein